MSSLTNQLQVKFSISFNLCCVLQDLEKTTKLLPGIRAISIGSSSVCIYIYIYTISKVLSSETIKYNYAAHWQCNHIVATT
jgi:uncharacterized protein YybS (DUF2232 family)